MTTGLMGTVSIRSVAIGQCSGPSLAKINHVVVEDYSVGYGGNSFHLPIFM